MEKANHQEALRALGIKDVRVDAPLARHCTWQVGGPAALLALPETTGQARAAVAYADRQRLPLTVLGGGSNVLIPDGGLPGLVLRLSGLRQLRFDGCQAYAEAGVPLPYLAQQCAARGLAGLDYAAGIPGTAGGAAVMNAGAHGSDFAQVVRQLICCDLRGEQVVMTAEEAGYGYRTSRFKREGRWVLLAVTLTLREDTPEAIRQRMAVYSARRQQSQPIGQPSAGSVFQNPPGDSAGRLIEAAGCKGSRLGGAMVSDIHSNFIVNTGGATCADILALISQVRERVASHSGIWLTPEVRVLGQDNQGNDKKAL